MIVMAYMGQDCGHIEKDLGELVYKFWRVFGFKEQGPGEMG